MHTLPALLNTSIIPGVRLVYFLLQRTYYRMFVTTPGPFTADFAQATLKKEHLCHYSAFTFINKYNYKLTCPWHCLGTRTYTSTD